MKWIPTWCSDCKPLSTGVTLRLLTCTLRGLESKFWNCLCTLWRRSCASFKLWQTYACLGVSTCISRVQGPAWQQTFCRAPQQISIFQLAKYKLGKALFQCQLRSYINGTYLKKGIPIRPVYHKCMHIIPDIMHDVISDIVSDVTFCLIGQSVVSTMTDQ